MGIFNNINEKINLHYTKPKSPLFLSSNTEDGGLFKWIVINRSQSLIQNGNKVEIKQNCTLIVIIDAIKVNKGQCGLLLKDRNSKILQSYKTENNRRNESVSITYADKFKTNDEIFIEGLNVKNIQLTIYGA